MPDRTPTPSELAAAADLLPVVLYDGACPFCVAQAERVRRLGAGAIRTRPLQEVESLVPWIDADETAQALTVVDEDGVAVRGAAAVVDVFVRVRPRFRPLRRVLDVAPVRWVAERVYAAVAARRTLLFGRVRSHDDCADGTCRLPYDRRRGPGQAK